MSNESEALGSALGSALHKSVRNGHDETTKALIKAGANVNAKNDKTSSVLHWASVYATKEIVFFLVGNGAHLDDKNIDGKTPLAHSSGHQRDDVSLALISCGADTKHLHHKMSFRTLTMRQATAQGGFTNRMIEMLNKEPSHLPGDTPEELANLSSKHKQSETAAAIQSFMASQMINDVLKQKKLEIA